MMQRATCDCCINTCLKCFGALTTLTLPVAVGQIQCSAPDELQSKPPYLSMGSRGSMADRGGMCKRGGPCQLKCVPTVCRGGGLHSMTLRIIGWLQADSFRLGSRAEGRHAEVGELVGRGVGGRLPIGGIEAGTGATSF